MREKKRGPIAAAELAASLAKNPEFLARRAERERERAERSARLRAEEKPIVADLHAVGVDVESVWDLVNSRTPYPTAIPVLVSHLTRPYSDTIRGGIARALAVPDARPFWAFLVGKYREEPRAGPGQGLGAKDGIAVALAAISTADVVAELIDLAKRQIARR